MATQKVTSVKAMESTVEQKVEGSTPAYGTPELFEIGTAAELVQGSVFARYYDRYSSGYTNWPN